MPIVQSRRHLLTNVAAAGATGFVGLGAAGLYGGRKSVAAEPPPEVTTISFEKDFATCIAPQAAEYLLRSEGFTDIRYVDPGSEWTGEVIARGAVDFGRTYAASFIAGMEAGLPITVLAGLHLGCIELFGRTDIRALADLKGRTVGISDKNIEDEALVRVIVGLVGLDPTKDIHMVSGNSLELFVEGKVDAFLVGPPDLQEVRTRNIGHVIVSSIADRPWSQYYCCMLGTRAEFAHNYPIATRRVLRAIMKGVDLCVSEPAQMAQLLVDNGYATRYDYALQALSEIRYDVWRDYDPEDSLRFYALRMHEVGLIKSNPQKLIAEHTDWRFLNELKREMRT
jgi:NitT/TauT family transport system substrate-binding protein